MRVTEAEDTKFKTRICVRDRSEPVQFRFCWDIYDVAGMSIRTSAGMASQYPRENAETVRGT